MLRRALLGFLSIGSFLFLGKKRALALETAASNDLLDQGDALLANGESWLGLKIVGYQFPNEIRDAYDSNWLMVLGHAGIDGRSWSFTDPCLLTTEVEALADWLVAVASGAASSQDCGFIEPNLYFKRSSPNTIHVSFSLESRPPWAEKGDFETEYGFEVPVGPSFLTMAERLRHQLEVFPKRG
ncbi:MAG: hypothetical protein QM647_13665 [Asticcacaulis sp.]|uniref:WapI family immunity protein n=1 Tax=Asticcacaulis sp. TaxID=1872648 RepID=UPI0039E4094A